MVGFFVRAGLSAIKAVKPLKKIAGSKTVKEHKKQISDIKSEAIGKKYRDEIGGKLTDLSCRISGAIQLCNVAEV